MPKIDIDKFVNTVTRVSREMRVVLSIDTWKPCTVALEEQGYKCVNGRIVRAEEK